jgi:hypothetical protein
VKGEFRVRLLQDYLDRIEALMAGGDEILSQRDPARGDEVKAKCTEAVVLIGSYHLFVHREIFEPMMASGDDRIRKQVCILKAECISLTEDLRVGVKALAAHDATLTMMPSMRASKDLTTASVGISWRSSNCLRRPTVPCCWRPDPASSALAKRPLMRYITTMSSRVPVPTTTTPVSRGEFGTRD